MSSVPKKADELNLSLSLITTFHLCFLWTVLFLALTITLDPSKFSHSLIAYKGLNTLRPRQNGRLFADDIFEYIFLNEDVWIPIKISLKFVPKGPIKNIPALVQMMAWRRPGDKPLSEPIMLRLPMPICVTRPQWVNLHHLVDILNTQSGDI